MLLCVNINGNCKEKVQILTSVCNPRANELSVLANQSAYLAEALLMHFNGECLYTHTCSLQRYFDVHMHKDCMCSQTKMCIGGLHSQRAYSECCLAWEHVFNIPPAFSHSCH